MPDQTMTECAVEVRMYAVPIGEFIPDCTKPNDAPAFTETGRRRIMTVHAADLPNYPEEVIVNGLRYGRRLDA